jgi:hypothetical protein
VPGKVNLLRSQLGVGHPAKTFQWLYDAVVTRSAAVAIAVEMVDEVVGQRTEITEIPALLSPPRRRGAASPG